MKHKNSTLPRLLEINIAMIFVSTSGALGRHIELPVPLTIASRAILAFLLLWVFCKWKGISLRLHKKDRVMVLLSGAFMGLHWITYFYALQLSNAAIGMLSLFTYPVLTAFLEPLLLKTKFQKIHVLLGTLVLCGIYFLVPNFDIQNSNTLAVGIGILSALFYAFRNLVLKNKVDTYNGSMLMCYQMAVTAFFLLPTFFIFDTQNIIGQWEELLTLAVLTTAIGHTLFLNNFKYFSVTTLSILSSIQPIYGILIAAFFLHEIPNALTIIGGLFILLAVVIESVRNYR